MQFVWSSSVDYALIERYKPDIVITQMAERFLKQIPGDDFDSEKFTFERIASFLAPKCSGDGAKWTITRQPS